MPATSKWFQTRKLTDDVWAIDDNGGSMIYLVCGSERALLIDTGWGIGDLPGLVRSLTPLPVTVVNTHVHPDHTFGNPQFDEVHIPDADVFMTKTPFTNEERQWALKDIVPQPLPPDFDATNWGTAMPASLVPIQDGYCFELGQRSIRVVAVPGHSPGSVCLLDRQSRRLFTGDMVLSARIWMHLEESCSLQQYARSLQKLQTLSDEFDGILPGHENIQKLPCPPHLIDDLLGGAEAILDGELVGEPEETFVGDGLRADFGQYSIVYRSDRLS
jgi:glyoxylase-like metal-dependent hydrolase (beta-lactamase superfamily II)